MTDVQVEQDTISVLKNKISGNADRREANRQRRRSLALDAFQGCERSQREMTDLEQEYTRLEREREHLDYAMAEEKNRLVAAKAEADLEASKTAARSWLAVADEVEEIGVEL